MSGATSKSGIVTPWRVQGRVDQMTGDAAKGALASGTQVPASAKDFVVGWLEERYGVTLK